MTIRTSLALGAMALTLSSCGGGGGSSNPPTQGPSGPPTLNVTLSQSSADVTVDEGGSATFGFTASYTGTSTSAIVADVEIGGRRYVLDDVSSNGNQFTVNLATVPFPAGGATSSDVTFRLCTTSACSTVYPGSTRTFTVNLDVQMGDWGMFQRNATHTGYAAVRYDPADFELAWEWDSGTAEAVSATRGAVYTIREDLSRNAFVVALDPADGSVMWETALGEQSYVSAPTFSAGKLYVTSMVSSSNDNPQWVLDAETGDVIRTMRFGSQWHDFKQPTVLDGQIYLAMGYYGNEVLSFNGETGGLNWQVPGTGGDIWDKQAVAADENYIYYFSGKAMDIFNRADGTLHMAIPNPAYDWRGYSWPGGPVLDGQGNIFGFSNPRQLFWDTTVVGYSMAERKQTWQTANRYLETLAFARNTLFASRHGAAQVDALDPATGAIKFSITLPNSAVATGNIVIADNLLFVGSGTRVYGFDLDQGNGTLVWQADAPSQHLAISPDNQLIASGDQKVVAFKLH